MVAWQAIFVLVVVVLALVVMATEVGPPDMIMMITVTLFFAMDFISSKEACDGFGNSSTLSVAFLFPVAYALELTGAMAPFRKMFLTNNGQLTSKRLLGHIVCKIMLPISLISVFVHNTPLMAMFMPVIGELCAKLHISPSKLYIPLTYSIILGGTCSILGTSTNLTVVGLVDSDKQFKGFNYKMGTFAMAKVGFPVLFAGLAYIIALGERSLPDRKGVVQTLNNPREYITMMVVTEKKEDGTGGELIGKTIAQAGLRKLLDQFLVEIRRGSEVIVAPGPEVTLAANDRIFFAGAMKNVIRLSSVKGLLLGNDLDNDSNIAGEVLEAVISTRSALAGKSIRTLNFRKEFNAAVLAVHRSGVRLTQNLGDIVLEPGDTLVIIGTKDFLQLHRNDPRFSVVVPVIPKRPFVLWKAIFSLLMALGIIFSDLFSGKDLNLSVLIAVILLGAARCITADEIRSCINLPVIIAMAASFAVSTAMVNTGASNLVGDALRAAAEPTGDLGLVVVSYFAVVVLTAVVTNNAAVTVMYPILKRATNIADPTDFEPYLFLLMFGASADFMTPTGYQTNLMAYGPGGYKFFDYTRFGVPLQVVVGIFTVGIVYRIDNWWVYLLISMFLLAGVLVYQQYFGKPLPPPPPPATTGDSAGHGGGGFYDVSGVDERSLPAISKDEVYHFHPDLGMELRRRTNNSYMPVDSSPSATPLLSLKRGTSGPVDLDDDEIEFETTV